MKVFYKSIITEIEELISDFYWTHGSNPTRVQMTRVEWDALQEEIKMHVPSFKGGYEPETCTIRGLLIRIKE